MSKSRFCAYGSAQTLAVLESCGQVRPVGQALEEVERARRAVVRLQACLTLFYPCFPPTRVAFWKRRLRRLTRALNALSDHLRLIRVIRSGETPAKPHRILLRLEQRVEGLLQKAHRAWERLQREHVPNEIRGLAKRQAAWGTGHDANNEVKLIAWTRWEELKRMNLKWLEGFSKGAGISDRLDLSVGTSHSIEVRWGRLQLMVEAAELLAPLLGEELPLQELHTRYRELSAQRFRVRAVEILTHIKEEERALALRYYGHLRGFGRIEREFDRWIAHFQSDMSDSSDLSDLSDLSGGSDALSEAEQS